MVKKIEIITCDRCGREITEPMPWDVKNKIIKCKFGKSKIKIDEVRRSGYLSEKDLLNPEIKTAVAYFDYKDTMKSYDLCCICTEELKEFLKNK